MGFGIAHHLAKLIDDKTRGGQVRIAHAQINHIPPLGARGSLHPVNFGEYVRGQAAQGVKFGHKLRVDHQMGRNRALFRPYLALCVNTRCKAVSLAAPSA